MSLVLERLTVNDRVKELDKLAGMLVWIVKDAGGTMSRTDALIALARKARISRSEVTLVLSYAKAEGTIATGPTSSQITAL